MKRLIIGLFFLVFVIAIAGILRAEEGIFYEGEVVECNAGKSITIKDASGKLLKFKAAEGNKIPMKECGEWKGAWIEAEGEIVRFITDSISGMTVKEFEEKINEIRNQAVANLKKSGKTVYEAEIASEAWKLAMTAYFTHLTKEWKKVNDYFFDRRPQFKTK